jgi:hypothetical protein
VDEPMNVCPDPDTDDRYTSYRVAVATAVHAKLTVSSVTTGADRTGAGGVWERRIDAVNAEKDDTLALCRIL